MRLPLPVTSLEEATFCLEQVQELGLYSGSGAPAFQARGGEFYFRRDTPATPLQRIYVNTADGANWSGVV